MAIEIDEIKKFEEHHFALSEMLEYRVGKVLADVKNIKENYIILGGHLNDLSTDIAFACEVNFYEYCDYKFGLAKTTVKNILSVFQQFTSNYLLKSDYQAYSFSQLVELSSMTSTEQKKIDPSMSVREIRDIKKSAAAANTFDFSSPTSDCKYSLDFKAMPGDVIIVQDMWEHGYYKCNVINITVYSFDSCDVHYNINYKGSLKGICGWQFEKWTAEVEQSYIERNVPFYDSTIVKGGEVGNGKLS